MTDEEEPEEEPRPVERLADIVGRELGDRLGRSLIEPGVGRRRAR